MTLLLTIFFNSHPRLMKIKTKINKWDLSKLNKGFPGGTVVKNLPANAGDAEDVGLIPGSGKSPEGGNGTHSSILAWKIPWTEETGGLQSAGSQRVGHD